MPSATVTSPPSIGTSDLFERNGIVANRARVYLITPIIFHHLADILLLLDHVLAMLRCEGR